MAKKKSSRKTVKSKKCSINLWYCGVALLSLVALVMIFATSVKLNGALTGTTGYTGLQTTFGYTDEFNLSMFSFSFMNLLTYLLVIAALVLATLKAFGCIKGKCADYVLICLFVVAGILFFLAPALSISKYAIDANKLVEGSVRKTLGIGSILSAVLCLVSAFVVCAKMMMKK